MPFFSKQLCAAMNRGNLSEAEIQSFMREYRAMSPDQKALVREVADALDEVNLVTEVPDWMDRTSDEKIKHILMIWRAWQMVWGPPSGHRSEAALYADIVRARVARGGRKPSKGERFILQYVSERRDIAP